MKNELCLILLLAVSTLLCACTREAPDEDAAIQTICETWNTETAETAVPDFTETTAPAHSPLYHPDYTPEQIWEYFEEVVLHTEYTDGIGDATLVQKWLDPIGIRIYGDATEEDLAVLEDLFAQLNQIPGFPGFYTAEAEGLEQLRISFLDPENFRADFSDAVGGEESYGAAQYWYYTDTNQIYSGRIGCRTDIPQWERNSVLVEEIVNILGISDTILREDSVTYQYSNENTVLSNADRILLNLLYHPDMRCGMDAESCAAMIQALYY